MKALIQKNFLLWGKKWKKLIFSGRSLCRSPIFTVGLELEGRGLSSEKSKEKEVKKQSKNGTT